MPLYIYTVYSSASPLTPQASHMGGPNAQPLVSTVYIAYNGLCFYNKMQTILVNEINLIVKNNGQNTKERIALLQKSESLSYKSANRSFTKVRIAILQKSKSKSPKWKRS